MRVKDQIGAHYGKASGSIEVEGAVDQTEQKPSSEEITPPVKPGYENWPSITPNPNAGEGWKPQDLVAHPGDYERPNQSDTERT